MFTLNQFDINLSYEYIYTSFDINLSYENLYTSFVQLSIPDILENFRFFITSILIISAIDQYRMFDKLLDFQ